MPTCTQKRCRTDLKIPPNKTMASNSFFICPHSDHKLSSYLVWSYLWWAPETFRAVTCRFANKTKPHLKVKSVSALIGNNLEHHLSLEFIFCLLFSEEKSSYSLIIAFYFSPSLMNLNGKVLFFLDLLVSWIMHLFLIIFHITELCYVWIKYILYFWAFDNQT